MGHGGRAAQYALTHGSEMSHSGEMAAPWRALAAALSPLTNAATIPIRWRRRNPSQMTALANSNSQYEALWKVISEAVPNIA